MKYSSLFKTTFMSFFVVCCFSWEALAKIDNYYCMRRGPLKIARKQFKSLAILGPATLYNVKVYQSLLVTGPAVVIQSTLNMLDARDGLEANESNFSSATISGPLLLENCIIEKELTVIGSLQARNSTVKNVSIVTDGKIIFDTSFADTLLIRENKSIKSHVVEVILKGKSSIRTIEFEQGVIGKVILEDKTASVGTVKNGTIKKNF